MKISLMNKTWEGANSRNNFLLGAVLALAISNGSLVVDRMRSHDRVVWSPPVMTENMWVTWNSASASYYKAFGLFFTVLTTNVTPKNAEFISDQLLPLVSPTIYPDVKKKLLQLAKDPVYDNVGASARFVVNQMIYEPQTSKVFVGGDLITQTAAGKPDNVPLMYELTISISEGRPQVTAMDNYDGTVAHTLDWISSHQAEIDAQAKKAKENL